MKKSYRLSAVLAGGLFLLLTLISAAFITVTYFSAYIIVENEDEELLESEIRFKDIVSVTADSVWETDENDHYVFLARDENTQNVIDMNKVLGKNAGKSKASIRGMETGRNTGKL